MKGVVDNATQPRGTRPSSSLSIRRQHQANQGAGPKRCRPLGSPPLIPHFRFPRLHATNIRSSFAVISLNLFCNEAGQAFALLRSLSICSAMPLLDLC